MPRREGRFSHSWGVLVIALLLAQLAPATAAGADGGAALPGLPDQRFGIAEGFTNRPALDELGLGWSRVVFDWSKIQPDGPGDFSRVGWVLPQDQLQAELGRGVRVTGLLQFTPPWAATDPSQGTRAVPRNLFLPPDDPDNYFARYVYETVRSYAGSVDEWILWNEPEFRPGDVGAGDSYTWLGSDEEFARLLKVGYLAAKRANPNAVVSFPATSYWVEELSSPWRPQFYERQLALLTQDPDAPANNFYHDVLALNLYRKPDDIFRIYGVFKGIQQKYGLDTPVWLTETNAMPSDDRAAPCFDLHATDPYHTTMREQTAFVVQAFALAAAAGYARMEFYKMLDDNSCQQVAVWGAARDDGSRRPVADALRTAAARFAGYARAQFVPLARDEQRWPAWPDDPGSYTPNWQLYQVALDEPGGQRVTVLWNGDAAPARVRIPRAGSGAHALDSLGGELALGDDGAGWTVELPGATASFGVNDVIHDPAGYHYIGGDPVLILESGVDPASPVVPPTPL